jgi:hypothetical protein
MTFLSLIYRSSLPAGFAVGGPSHKLIILIAVLALLAVVLLVAAAYLRRSSSHRHHRRQHHSHHHHAGKPSGQAAGTANPAPIKKWRRRRRRDHRPRNPTLAETGGLPPIRSESAPERPV